MNPLTYQPRDCRYIDNLTLSDGCYKLYEISADPLRQRAQKSEGLLNGWVTQANEGFRVSADHGVGFAIIHFGADGDYLLLSRWTDANMLRHRVFSVNTTNALTALEDTSIIACVWELKLMMAERDFWIDEVLTAADDTPDARRFQHYLAKYFEGPL
jgi:hypothetical protein